MVVDEIWEEWEGETMVLEFSVEMVDCTMECVSEEDWVVEERNWEEGEMAEWGWEVGESVWLGEERGVEDTPVVECVWEQGKELEGFISVEEKLLIEFDSTEDKAGDWEEEGEVEYCSLGCGKESDGALEGGAVVLGEEVDAKLESCEWAWCWVSVKIYMYSDFKMK